MTAQMQEHQGHARQKPGSTGKGDYYHVEVLPKTGFVTFRTQDVGRRGHIQRVAGRRQSGSWATVKWLIGKRDAHIRGERLIPDTKAAREVIEQLGSQPVHTTGDRFRAKPRPNVTRARAQSKNIKRAQAVRRGK